jgi:hypothetical protein
MIETSLFFTIWGILFAGHISMKELPSSILEEISQKIDNFNSEHIWGDNSVDPEELAEEYKIPLKKEKLRYYCQENEVKEQNYISGARSEVGRPLILTLKFYFFHLNSLVLLTGALFLFQPALPKKIYLTICFIFLSIELLLWISYH